MLPDLPTVAESGVPGYENSTWHGWLAPAGTPAAILSRLNAELVKSAKAPDVVERLAPDGGEAVGSTPEQFNALTRDGDGPLAKDRQGSGCDAGAMSAGASRLPHVVSHEGL